MRALVALAAWSDLAARLRTSSATTAKPLPAVPARAASTAAFRARMLVWKAMSSMVLRILLISWELSLISAMASIISCILLLHWVMLSPTSLALLLALRALSAFWVTCWETSLMEAASSSTELACSVEPWARTWAPLAT